MRFQEFEKLISHQRLLRYRLACGNDTRKTMKLYRANIRISLAFLATVGILEVVLRNKIDAHYKVNFPAPIGGQEWLLASTLPGGFFTGASCNRSFQKITQAYSNLGNRYSHDKLLAEMSFGFWKFMFAGNQFLAGGSTLLNIFPLLPSHTNQGVIYAKLDKINSVRNRVAHHEPICFGSGNTVNTTYARSHYQEMLELLDWMNINADQLFYGIDGVKKEADYIDQIL